MNQSLDISLIKDLISNESNTSENKMANSVLISDISSISDKPNANILVICGTLCNDKGQI